tara:strand:+ start:230 stop:535 length:306 start_codon:yes stop_codon:yes gene_type:complete
VRFLSISQEERAFYPSNEIEKNEKERNEERLGPTRTFFPIFLAPPGYGITSRNFANGDHWQSYGHRGHQEGTPRVQDGRNRKRIALYGAVSGRLSNDSRSP